MQFHYRFWSKIAPNPLKEIDPHPSSVMHLWPTQLALVDGSLLLGVRYYKRFMHYKVGSSKIWNRIK